MLVVVIEIYRIAEMSGSRPIREIGIPAAAVAPFAAFAASPDGPGLSPIDLLFAAAVLVLVVMAVAVWRRSPEDRPLSSVAVTLFGVIYASGLVSLLIMLRHPSAPVTAWGGTWLVFLPLTIVWVCDSTAMAAGKLIGGPKLAPVVSPNKTWAGTISGSAVSLVLAPAYGRLLLTPFGIDIGTWSLVVFGLLVSALGQFGDLGESLFKREVRVKDSGTFFPGHGGVLDRLDSLYWAIPISVILLSAFGAI